MRKNKFGGCCLQAHCGYFLTNYAADSGRLMMTVPGSLKVSVYASVVSSKSAVNNRYIDMDDRSMRTSNTNRPLPVPPERKFSMYDTVPADSQNTTSGNANGKPPDINVKSVHSATYVM